MRTHKNLKCCLQRSLRTYKIKFVERTYIYLDKNNKLNILIKNK